MTSLEVARKGWCVDQPIQKNPKDCQQIGGPLLARPCRRDLAMAIPARIHQCEAVACCGHFPIFCLLPSRPIQAFGCNRTKIHSNAHSQSLGQSQSGHPLPPSAIRRRPKVSFVDTRPPGADRGRAGRAWGVPSGGRRAFQQLWHRVPG